MDVRKDRSLDLLARSGNVAQFVSFAPGADGELAQHYSRIAGFEPNHSFETPQLALYELLARSSDGAINLRSYLPSSPRSQEFVYGLRSLSDAMEGLRRLIAKGLFVIANETIDVNDGGVSGVIHGNIVEFAPDDTPRCVEKSGVASLSRHWALTLLETVYGFRPDLDVDLDCRMEFSIHPRKRGWKLSHTLAWEIEEAPGASLEPSFGWPNRFSRHIGDKAYGLLMADLAGLPVPRTTVIGRRVAPFAFGTPTGSAEVWTRTCPNEPQPGLYTTVKGWTDPFRLMMSEDPEHHAIASVICQDAVPAAYSGAAIVTDAGQLHVEGVRGEGDALMLGQDHAEELPAEVLAGVTVTYEKLVKLLGPVRFEWVHDGARVWVVQLHKGATTTSATVLVPGDADTWVSFPAAAGLEALRRFLQDVPAGTGVSIEGEIGLTSHLADLIRKAQKPARIATLA